MQCSPTDKSINKTCSVHTAESEAALKREGILTPATVWMSLLLCEMSRSPEDKYSMTPLNGRNLKQSNLQKSQKVVSQGWEKKESCCSLGQNFNLGRGKAIGDGVRVAQ